MSSSRDKLETKEISTVSEYANNLVASFRTSYTTFPYYRDNKKNALVIDIRSCDDIDDTSPDIDESSMSILKARNKNHTFNMSTLDQTIVKIHIGTSNTCVFYHYKSQLLQNCNLYIRQTKSIPLLSNIDLKDGKIIHFTVSQQVVFAQTENMNVHLLKYSSTQLSYLGHVSLKNDLHQFFVLGSNTHDCAFFNKNGSCSFWQYNKDNKAFHKATEINGVTDAPIITDERVFIPTERGIYSMLKSNYLPILLLDRPGLCPSLNFDAKENTLEITSKNQCLLPFGNGYKLLYYTQISCALSLHDFLAPYFIPDLINMILAYIDYDAENLRLNKAINNVNILAEEKIQLESLKSENERLRNEKFYPTRSSQFSLLCDCRYESRVSEFLKESKLISKAQWKEASKADFFDHRYDKLKNIDKALDAYHQLKAKAHDHDSVKTCIAQLTTIQKNLKDIRPNSKRMEAVKSLQKEINTELAFWDDFIKPVMGKKM